MGYKEQYEFWLEDSYFDENTKQELQAIKSDEKDIEERFYKDLERSEEPKLPLMPSPLSG